MGKRLGRLAVVGALAAGLFGLSSCSKDGGQAAAAVSTSTPPTTTFVFPDVAEVPAAIEAVLVHPPVTQGYWCSEHALGELEFVGDALGTDCVVTRLIDGVAQMHANDGSKNEDWYGWNVPLLAPFDSVVEEVSVNNENNTPGTLGKPPATAITFKRADGMRVVYAHVQAVEVKVGDQVRAGQRVARIGNNGSARSPHVHIAAWRDKTPFQIRFDLAALGRVRGIR
jgi:hypothetical protein